MSVEVFVNGVKQSGTLHLRVNDVGNYSIESASLYDAPVPKPEEPPKAPPAK